MRDLMVQKVLEKFQSMSTKEITEKLVENGINVLGYNEGKLGSVELISDEVSMVYEKFHMEIKVVPQESINFECNVTKFKSYTNFDVEVA